MEDQRRKEGEAMNETKGGAEIWGMILSVRDGEEKLEIQKQTQNRKEFTNQPFCSMYCLPYLTL